ncbi:nucleoside hydrolase [Pontibacter silvestris]|uniref:Nucleoside hydrolase n=1 Tax=Pontibacter silvestris TaxID=2305183 RepID=A0ABW4WUN1_9BACT|nr:nucleoside hydrolase [Pontibacter silvestris]MCC9137802.1 nucleoside hydrolase [Pontibacter silvestris]
MMTDSLQKKKQVLFDHDGGVDDFLSLILLLYMQQVNVLGVSITPADCYLENALETTLKLLSLANKTDVEVGVGHYHGVNAFPADWRAKPKILNALPGMINIEAPFDTAFYADSIELIIRKVSASPEPVIVLLTGPCSNLVHALKKEPAIAANIAEVVWMGGAVDVVGNVKTYNHNGTAEWNVFWDPISANKLFKLGLPVTIVPLDATNSVPVTFDFLKQLALQSSFFASDLAGQFWATTIDTIPSYEYTYFMWDVLTTSYLAIPEAFEFENVELDVSPSGADAGRTFRKPGSGQWIKVATNVNKAMFYDYLLNQLKQGS